MKPSTKHLFHVALFALCLLASNCTTLLPATSTIHGDIQSFKYIYIAPTMTLTSGSGMTYAGQYISTTKTINPSDVIVGLLSKRGFIILPEINPSLNDQTLFLNYGESGKRGTELSGYALEVTIQFISASTTTLVASCTAEGQGSTEADDIREAIHRCVDTLLPTNTN
jgi:hypothetical protein